MGHEYNRWSISGLLVVAVFWWTVSCARANDFVPCAQDDYINYGGVLGAEPGCSLQVENDGQAKHITVFKEEGDCKPQVSPAIVNFTLLGNPAPVNSYTIDTGMYGCEDTTATTSYCEYAYYWFDFDPTIFSIPLQNGRIEPGECLFLFHTTPNVNTQMTKWLVTLAINPENLTCEKLEEIKDAEVKIYCETVRSWSYYSFNPSWCSFYPIRGQGCRMYVGQVGTVKLKYEVHDISEECEHDPDAEGEGAGPSGCPSCSGGSGSGGGGGDSGGPPGIYEGTGSGYSPAFGSTGPFSSAETGLSIGSARAGIGRTQDETLSFYGSVYEYGGDFPEVNTHGFWFKAGHTTGWSGGVQYLKDGTNKVTRVAFQLTSPNQTTYKYWTDGNWETESAAKYATYGRVQLRYVIDKNQVTKRQYTYDLANNRATVQTPVAGGGDGYVIYQGGVDPSNPATTLSRIWTGKELLDYRAAGTNPVGGRWTDLDVEIAPESGIPLVKGFTSCSSCGGATKKYEYIPSSINRMPGPTYPENPNDYAPTSYKISRLLDKNESVLRSYTYDSQDRHSGRWLGDREKPVTQWTYTDYTWVLKNDPQHPQYDPEEDTELVQEGSNSLTRRNYVDSTHYRASVYSYDTSNRLTEERFYHNLQTGANPVGPFSTVSHEYARDGSGNITKKMDIVPNGNRVVEFYQSYGYSPSSWEVTKRIQYYDYVANPDDSRNVTTDYSYALVGENFDECKLSWSTNPNGATTHYYYDYYGKLTKQMEPASGAYGSTSRLCRIYEYDGDDRVTKDYAQDDAQPPVLYGLTTYYDYDSIGNMTAQRRGDVTTHYQYNEFNEQTLSYEANAAGTDIRNIRRTIYDGSGVAVARRVCEGTAETANVISGTEFVYDGDGRLVTRKVVNNAAPCTEANLTYDLEVYDYDAFGRRTMAIRDPGGEALTTRYAYDNQSQVTQVTAPDGSSTTTLRDGRGLTSVVINAANGNTSTTQFFYDISGNLTKKKDPQGVCDFYEYDGLNRKIRSRRGRES